MTAFSKFETTMRAFDDRRGLRGSLLNDLLMGNEGPLTCVYAPFDHTPATAQLAIVGITPGRAQAEIALSAAGTALRSGKSHAEAARLAKLAASFGGRQTRNNLVAMLNVIGGWPPTTD